MRDYEKQARFIEHGHCLETDIPNNFHEKSGSIDISTPASANKVIYSKNSSCSQTRRNNSRLCQNAQFQTLTYKIFPLQDTARAPFLYPSHFGLTAPQPMDTPLVNSQSKKYADQTDFFI